MRTVTYEKSIKILCDSIVDVMIRDRNIVLTYAHIKFLYLNIPTTFRSKRKFVENYSISRSFSNYQRLQILLRDCFNFSNN